jgi:hypothetical protein
MLNNIYQAIKSQLTTPTNSINGNPRTGTGKPVEWYNVQYEGTMINDDGFFVQFPELLNFQGQSKELRRAPVKIRVHCYSKALQTHDGITDDSVEAHEVLALKAKALLDGHTPTNGSCSRLSFAGWQHWHRWKGWMVTFIDFEAKKSL